MDFKEHLRTFMSEKDVMELLESLNQEPKHSFYTNQNRVGDITEIFDENFIKHPLVENGYFFEKTNNQLGKNILFFSGAYYIQEPSAMMAIQILKPKPGDKVLDMCAAPGGKCIQALNFMNDKGLMVCNDLSENRSKILASNIEKFGFMNCIVLNDSSSNYKKHFQNYFDKIILDAPCSGSGMFRKHELVKNDWSLEKVLSCSKTQKELIDDAYEMLKPGGYLLYSTCSYSIQENEEIIQYFLSNHTDCKVIPLQNPLYKSSIGIFGAIRLHPNHFPGEGHFIALIKKEDGDIKTELYHKKKASCICRHIPNEIDSFLKEISYSIEGELLKFGSNYSLINFPYLDIKNCKIIRYGLPIGEISNNRFIPHHSLAMYWNLNKRNYLELSSDEAKDYLKGLTLKNKEGRGYRIVSYKNCPLGWGKLSNNQLKNHLPKGLRHFL